MQTTTIAARVSDDVARSDPLAAIYAARDLVATDRATALAALQALFREGAMPEEMDGTYRGILVATTLGVPVDRLVAVWAERNLRWLGKRFTITGGDNIWRSYRGAADRLFWHLNRLLRWQAVAAAPGTYRAFPFRTTIGPGVADPDCTVLKIIHDARPNPLPVRRVLDELVVLGEGIYLGKAHGRFFGHWHLCAYFALVWEGGSR